MAVNVKITVFRDVTPYNLADRYQHFREYPKMEKASSSKTMVHIFQTIWCHMRGDCNLNMPVTTLSDNAVAKPQTCICVCRFRGVSEPKAI